MRHFGLMLLGIAGGAIVGVFLVAIYNHETCSTFTQQLEGCRVVKPAVGLLLGGVAGAILGAVLSKRRSI